MLISSVCLLSLLISSESMPNKMRWFPANKMWWFWAAIVSRIRFAAGIFIYVWKHYKTILHTTLWESLTPTGIMGPHLQNLPLWNPLNIVSRGLRDVLGPHYRQRGARAMQKMQRTQRNLFKILSNETEIRLHLPFSNWFRTADGRSVFCSKSIGA